MKVVINKCFGGFGLSPLGLKRYTELKGIKCFFFRAKMYDDRGYEPLTIEEASKISFWTAFNVPNPDEVLPDQTRWSYMTLDERKASNEEWEKYSIDYRSIERNDPFLIKVIEELGESASGKHSELKIVEIPDDVKWEIEEYDGLEKIRECSRVWG